MALTLLAPDGAERQMSIAGGDFAMVRKLRPSPAATGAVPRYLSSLDKNYWLERLPDHGAWARGSRLRIPRRPYLLRRLGLGHDPIPDEE